jgi:acyl-CoA synthetase (AMP-forming)/AMP-acid ligase II
MILMRNRLEYPEIDLGIVTGGFIRVALNVRLQLADHVTVAADCAARVLFSDPSTDGVAAELVDKLGLLWIRIADEGPRPDTKHHDYETLIRSSPIWPATEPPDSQSIAWISYTSGTTGTPKGVELSHRAIQEVARNITLAFGPASCAKGILLPQPVSHGAGYFVLPYLAAGGTVHLMSRWDPHEAVTIGRDEHLATLKCVPDMLNSMVNQDVDATFSTVIYGAAPMRTAHLEAALARYGPIMTQIYGQTEAPATITLLSKADHARPGAHRGSVGRTWPYVAGEVCDPDGHVLPIGEIGELAVRAPQMMSGYHRRPEATAEVIRGGWLWTRDMASRDEDGYLYLHGRSDDMINSGGYNIAPREVEDVILTHPAVQDVCVIGVDDARWGQTVMAYLVLRDGAPLTAAEVETFCRARLGFRRPRRLAFLPELPRNGYGKIDRGHLRDLALDNLEGGGA